MTYFILTFDRRRSEVALEPFEDVDMALERLHRAEVAQKPGQEIVLLYARSEEDLRRTHARYFHGIDEMISSVEDGFDEEIVSLP